MRRRNNQQQRPQNPNQGPTTEQEIGQGISDANATYNAINAGSGGGALGSGGLLGGGGVLGSGYGISSSGAIGAVPATPEVISSGINFGTSGASAAAAETAAGSSSQAAPAIASTSASGIGWQAAGTALAQLGGAYNAYQGFQAHHAGMQDSGRSRPGYGAASGAQMGAGIGSTIAPGIGTVIGAIIGGAAGFLGEATQSDKLFGSSKAGHRRERKEVTEGLKKYGFLDEDGTLKLSDGTVYDWASEDVDEQGFRNYETDPDDPENAELIGMMNPLGYILAHGRDRLKAQTTNKFVRTLRMSKDKKASAKEIYTRLGLDNYGVVRDELLGQYYDGKIDKPTYLALLNGARTALDVEEGPAPTRQATSRLEYRNKTPDGG